MLGALSTHNTTSPPGSLVFNSSRISRASASRRRRSSSSSTANPLFGFCSFVRIVLKPAYVYWGDGGLRRMIHVGKDLPRVSLHQLGEQAVQELGSCRQEQSTGD